MSFITPASVQAIAHSIDIPNLSDEAAKALAPDVEYRMREIIQVRCGGVAARRNAGARCCFLLHRHWLNVLPLTHNLPNPVITAPCI